MCFVCQQKCYVQSLENNIHKIYLKGKFLISLPTKKGFGFPHEKSFPTKFHAITQHVEVILTDDKSHFLIHQSNLHETSEFTIPSEFRIKVLSILLRSYCLFLTGNVFMKRQLLCPFSAFRSQHLHINPKTPLRLIKVDHHDSMCNNLTQNGKVSILFTDYKLSILKG
jgi:hypothetical protein